MGFSTVVAHGLLENGVSRLKPIINRAKPPRKRSVKKKNNLEGLINRSGILHFLYKN